MGPISSSGTLVSTTAAANPVACAGWVPVRPVTITGARFAIARLTKDATSK